MKTEQIKIFESTKQLLEHYAHIEDKSSTSIGHLHFMVPIKHQLKWFNEGLGSVTFFETIKNNNITEVKGEFFYRMHTEYVKNLKMGEIKDNEITEPAYIKADGFDDCLIGLGFKFGNRGTLIYDQAKVIQKLIDNSEGKITEEEALEYYDYNILGAYVGENMPIFVESCTMDDIQEMIDQDCPEDECCGGECHQTDS